MRDKLFLFILIFLGVIFYTLTLKGIYGNPPGKSIKNNLDQASKPFGLSPERDRFLLTQSLAENKSFALSQELADAAYPDVGYYKGKFYIFFAPGISLFALPFYSIGKYFNLAQVASYSVITLFAIGNMIFLYKISREILKLPVWISILTSLIFAFGSTSWSYAVTLYQHHATTFFIISGFYAVWKYKQKKKFGWVWGFITWLNFALAGLIDYPNIILMAPVMLYFFLSSCNITPIRSKLTISLRTAFLTTSVIFFLITALHGYYNYVNFGDFKRVSGSLTGYKAIKEQKLFEKKNGQAQITKIGDNKQPIHFFKQENFIHSSSTLLFSRDRGLFLYSPIFILGILGIFYKLKKMSMETAILLGTMGSIFFLYSSWGDPWGGYAFGPRYMIPVMAVLSLFIGIWLSKFKYQLLGKLITFLLFIYSIGIALVGVLTTNSVPPKVEADYFKVPYNFILNFQYLLQGRSSSYIYNQYFANHISLLGFYLILTEVLIMIVYGVLFFLPKLKVYED